MDKNKPQHILIIRLSAMGDVAMIIPVLSALKETYPDLQITVLTRAQFAPIFNSFSNIKIVEADLKGRHKGFFGIYRLYRELKQLRLTAVADLHNVLRSNILKLFFRTTPIRFAQINKGRKEKAALTRPKNKIFKQLQTTHERYAIVFKNLGYTIALDKVKPLKKIQLNSVIKEITSDKKQRWVGIAPFAAHKGKMYPLQLIEEVITSLSKENNLKIILFGGGEREVATLTKIKNNFKETVINIAGKISFIDELSLISNLDLMLSMDSANGHLATNYGIPVVTVWGVTHPYAGFAPYGQPEEYALVSNTERYPLIPTSVYGNKHPKGYENAIETIAPERIVNMIKRILG